MDKNTEPKKCDKCEGYLCVCKGRSYTPPEPFTGTPRYHERNFERSSVKL